MSQTSQEAAVRAVIARLDAAWQNLEFDDFEDCFAEDAVIVGPDYQPAASGRVACAESYREFACNAAIIDYSESGHQLHLWEHLAVYTFAWRMTYEREAGPKAEAGTDELVLGLVDNQWRIVFRHINFTSVQSP